MCGINGILSSKKISNLEDRIQKMNDSILHRGPDAGGIYIDNNIALGHRRLAIIDTSDDGIQPMHKEEWHITFNGEIYNYQEIRQKLTSSCLTETDTEVILLAIHEKGLDWFLEQANGMFAIALFNEKSKQLFLIRDRLGIKPLHYHLGEDNFVFSSEIKGILNSGLVEANFNEAAIDEYLANRYVRAPYTFFKDIYQVESGSYLEIDTEKLTVSKSTFWELPKEFNTETVFNESEIIEELDKELNDSINYRLIADVPLGAYLSGGVDSSLLSAITALKKQEPINTYTIGFPELNEFNYSKPISIKYNTKHHEILMKKEDYMNNWENLILYKDAPLGVPNEIPLAKMSSELKKDITVVLSGEGADELLGGYGRIFRAAFDFKNHYSNDDFYTFFIKKYEYTPRSMRDELINTSIIYRDQFDKKIKEEFSTSSNEENIFRFFHQYHVKGLLQRVDITTMQTAVEARVPFLDHKLIEFSYKKVPYSLKLKWINDKAEQEAKKLESKDYSEKLDIPKYALRKLSYKYLPSENIERKKVGFPVPLTDWFTNLEELARKYLTECNWLKKGVIEELLLKSKSEDRAGQILWMFINIELFRKNYFNKSWVW